MKKKSLLIPTLSGLLVAPLVLGQPVRAEEITQETVQPTTVAAEQETQLDPTTQATTVAPETTDTAPTTAADTTSPSEESINDQSTPVSEPMATPVVSQEQATTTTTSQTAETTITILHTNDIHGRIEGSSSVIGMAKLGEIVDETRAQGPTLVLDAGDAFQGMPISNSTKGEDMARLMNQVQYDAMAVGNHEFDFGLDQAKKYKELLKFPILSANTYANDVRIFEASTIIDKTPDIVGDEFVVIGVTTPETATKTHPNNVKGVIFKDPITEVNQVISQVESSARAEGKTYNNYIILSHLGVDSTTPVEWRGSTLAEALSKNKELTGKNVIVIDGHSHTLLSNHYGDNITYNQTGSYLNNIGKITLNSNGVLSAGVISAEETANTAANENLAKEVEAIKAKFIAENSKVLVPSSPVELNGDRSNVRVRETNQGNAITDALWQYGQTGFAHKTNLAVMNGGGIRATIAKGQPITVGDVISVLPFGNIVSQITVNGQTIKDMFTKSLSSTLQKDVTGQLILDDQNRPIFEASGGLLHVSGARVYYDPTLPIEKRILRIEIVDPETGRYQLLDEAKTYYLATNDFLAAGGDGYTMLGGAREEGPSLDTIYADFLTRADLSQYAVITPSGRLIYIDSQKDSDGDGYLDIDELTKGTNPQDPKSYPRQLTPEKAIPAPQQLMKQQVVRPLVKASSTKALTIPVTYKLEAKETVLPATGEDEALYLLVAGLALVSLTGYATLKKGYGQV